MATSKSVFFISPTPPLWLWLGSPMLIDPNPSQQLHAGVHHAVWQLQQEVTRSMARFKPTISLWWMRDQIRCQHILVSCFTCTFLQAFIDVKLCVDWRHIFVIHILYPFCQMMMMTNKTSPAKRFDNELALKAAYLTKNLALCFDILDIILS